MKYFTPAEANKMLPLVKGIVTDILTAGQLIRTLSSKIDKPEEDPEINRLMDQLDELFDELEGLGCSYRDWNFSEGLVDFPAMIRGQEALLCWKSNEDEVLFYHDLESGFAGRLPIPREHLAKIFPNKKPRPF